MSFLVVCDTCGLVEQSTVGESPRAKDDSRWFQKDVQLRTTDGEPYVHRYHFCSAGCEKASNVTGWVPHIRTYGLLG